MKSSSSCAEPRCDFQVVVNKCKKCFVSGRAKARFPDLLAAFGFLVLLSYRFFFLRDFEEWSGWNVVDGSLGFEGEKKKKISKAKHSRLSIASSLTASQVCLSLHSLL